MTKYLMVRTFHFILFFGFATLGVAAPDSPNIMVILVDDLGYGDLSCQGGTDIQTPNIDALFADGLKMTNFYANCTVCSPTRASLMTGKYPDLAGVPGVIRTHEENSWGFLDPQAVSLPDKMKEAGYRTALVGKWHLGLESPNKPNERGFDYFHGFLGDMMDDYWTHLRYGNNYMRENDRVINPEGHATDVFSDWAIDYINQSKGKSQPFFLYLAYNAPHFPIQPPQEWVEKVKKREGNIDEKRLKNIAFVEHLDDGIGRVISSLKKSGQYDNTVIIFSSDNGGHLPSGASNGTLRGGKQDMYEGGIKVPTCMVWKNKIPAGGETSRLGLTMDLFPTLCAIAGIEPPAEIDGVNIYPSENAGIEEERTVYFMRREGGGKYGGLCYYAIRKGPYKLLQNTPYEALQLFNIEKDYQEKNLIENDSEEYKNLQYDLSQHIRKSGAVPWQEK